MRVLVACEFSGVVRRAFRALGHHAMSVDLESAEDGADTNNHVRTDVRRAFEWGSWDLIIAHPPCTHLAVSGARWFKDKKLEQAEAISFFMQMVNAPAFKVAVENPISIMSSVYRKPDQIIQPWQFGHGETKATCLWLKGLPKLTPTNVVSGREAKVHRMPPGPNRWKERSRTYTGIAEAMADQWGALESQVAA
jgi:hypothetical protein